MFSNDQITKRTGVDDAKSFMVWADIAVAKCL